MPFARLTLHPAQTPDTTSRLAADLTSAIAKDLGKRHELTSLLIETPASARWTIGAEDREVTAHLEVCVTAGTNSEEEKRIFVRNAMALLRRALPTLAEATYVVVTELPSVNWGYDGRTQADRATGLVPPGSA
ncbi:MAG: hypothetical protein CME90_00500 [Hoeflea sp.]|nr:hypothetical protein [Hoeflea sp.]|tara:strand:+ start:2590 stop:2988 length:399 start_codon:yes stop_codon:yes gene_type:complete